MQQHATNEFLAKGEEMNWDWVGMADIFIDPQGVARRVGRRRTWIGPLVVLGCGGILLGLVSLPFVLQAVKLTLPSGLTEEQVEELLDRLVLYQRLGLVLSPLLLALKCWFVAGILYISCVLWDLPARMRQTFSLTVHGSLIFLLGEWAAFLVVKLRGSEIHSVEDLSPRLGFDLLVSGLSRPAMALLNHFSIFTLWYVVMITLSLSYLTGCTKRRAFLAAIPMWAFPLGLKVALVWISTS
jgi:hypothetical protein